MASIKKLVKLFNAVATNDLTSASAIAIEIASAEASKGHHEAARILRGAIRNNGSTTEEHSPFTFHSTKNGGIAGALQPSISEYRLDDVMLRPQWRKELLSIIKEWTFRVRLESKSIRRRSRLFFYGPPGCGKSLTAYALGRELNLPTFLVRFDAIIGAYLGQTAIHLRELFRFAESTPCVLLIDEVDALGKKRGNPLDVGELDRIVIALMQELEHSKTKGIVIATSNMPKHLDDALWRRFDLSVEFPSPNKNELRHFANRISSKYNTKLTTGVTNKCLKTRNYADAESMIEAHARDCILRNL